MDEEDVEEANADVVVEEDEEDRATKDRRQQYFVRSRLERETMYSQLLATYQKMYNNINSTAEQKSEAMGRISEINRVRNAIMIAENLVVARGIEDIVIFANSNSTSVVIKAEEITPEQMAQVQHIVSRELAIGIETMNISTK